MGDNMSEAEALRNAERALEAINKASPLTRRRVTNILHNYNASIERKIDRLNTMLHHDSTELFVMASNESALPFRAVQAETRRMFSTASQGFTKVIARTSAAKTQSDKANEPTTNKPSLSEGELHQLALLEATRYDALQSEAMTMLRDICHREEHAGKELIDRSRSHVDDAFNLCSCAACCSFATEKLDRLLQEALVSATNESEKRFTANLGLSSHGDIIPSHMLRQMRELVQEQTVLALEEKELEGCLKRMKASIALIESQQDTLLVSSHSVGDAKKQFQAEDNTQQDSPTPTLADSLIEYSHQIVSHTSALRAHKMDTEGLEWTDAAAEIATRLEMLSLLLPSQ